MQYFDVHVIHISDETLTRFSFSDTTVIEVSVICSFETSLEYITPASTTHTGKFNSLKACYDKAQELVRLSALNDTSDDTLDSRLESLVHDVEDLLRENDDLLTQVRELLESKALLNGFTSILMLSANRPPHLYPTLIWTPAAFDPFDPNHIQELAEKAGQAIANAFDLQPPEKIPLNS